MDEEEEGCGVLVVDDDPAVRELLGEILAPPEFEVVAVGDARAAREALQARRPHIALLDVGLAGEDGLSLARHIREHHDIGIVMVSGAGETVDRIVGLEVGADDYVAKPFDPRELRARVRSVLRRYRRRSGGAYGDSAAERTVRVGGATLHPESRRLVAGDGSEIPLTGMEFDLLCAFVERPNRPLSRDQLLNLTRNRDWDPFDRSIDIRIARLRRKIEPDPGHPVLIRTVRGVGYMYVPADSRGAA